MKAKYDRTFLYWVNDKDKNLSPKWVDEKTMMRLKKQSEKDRDYRVSVMMKSEKHRIVFYDEALENLKDKKYSIKKDTSLSDVEKEDETFCKGLLMIRDIFEEFRNKGFVIEQMSEHDFIKIANIGLWKQNKVLERL